MKIAKPLAVSLLHRVVEHGGGFHFVVGGMVCVPLAAPSLPVAEMEMWKSIVPALGGAVLDDALPKPRGEVLVTGSAFTPGGRPAVACDVRVQIGPIDKTLRAIGDRTWDRAGAPTSPAPFTELPLRYEHAFGGEGHALNPTGKGAAAVAGPGGAVVPLPNVEDPREPVRTPDDRPPPAGLGPLGPTWALRASRMGTYDDRWFRDEFPGLPRDLDWAAFNAAPPDQWIDGRWRGDERFVLENLHPTQPRIEGALPGLAVRVFLTQVGPDGGDFREVPVALETVHFFPTLERAVLIFRGTTPVAEDDAADVHALVAGLEHAASPKDLEHYRGALARRLDRSRTAQASLRDDDLMPEGVDSGLAALTSGAPRAEGLFEANQRRRLEAELGRARDRLRAQGIDPDKHLPGTLPAPPAAMSPSELAGTMESRRQEAEAAHADAEARRARVLAEAKAAGAKLGVDVDALMAAGRSVGGPPTLSADREIARLRSMLERSRAMGVDAPLLEARLADPELRRRLERAELAALEGYRATAHHQPAAAPLAEALNARARRFVEARRVTGESCASWDFTGADLSDMDLAGMDLRNALMEGVKLRGCNLAGADLSGALLARADLSGARLDGASMAGANLGGASLRGAIAESAVDLRGATLWSTDLAGASLTAVRLDGTRLFETSLRTASLRTLSAVRATFLRCDLSEMVLAGADLSDAMFLGCTLTRADLSDAVMRAATLLQSPAEGVILRGAALDKLRVVESSLAGADLREARLVDASVRGASFSGARLAGAALDRTDFSGCDLRGADLSRVSARGARFVRADLRGAVLRSARLVHAIMQKARIEGADLGLANLFGADLSRSRGAPSDLEGARLARAVVSRRVADG